MSVYLSSIDTDETPGQSNSDCLQWLIDGGYHGCFSFNGSTTVAVTTVVQSGSRGALDAHSDPREYLFVLLSAMSIRSSLSELKFAGVGLIVAISLAILIFHSHYIDTSMITRDNAELERQPGGAQTNMKCAKALIAVSSIALAAAIGLYVVSFVSRPVPEVVRLVLWWSFPGFAIVYIIVMSVAIDSNDMYSDYAVYDDACIDTNAPLLKYWFMASNEAVPKPVSENLSSALLGRKEGIWDDVWNVCGHNLSWFNDRYRNGVDHYPQVWYSKLATTDDWALPLV